MKKLNDGVYSVSNSDLNNSVSNKGKQIFKYTLIFYCHLTQKISVTIELCLELIYIKIAMKE